MIVFKEENNLLNDINKYKKITKITSIIRIILAILVALFVILLLSLKEYLLYSILSGATFIIFILFMLLTNKYYKKLNHLLIKKDVYNKHNNRRCHNLNKIFDKGTEFIEKDDYKESDLDLFGDNSLYQYLNISKTKYGRIKLANLLKHGQERNNDYSDALMELSKDEKTLNIEASINNISNQASKLDIKDLLSNLNQKIKFNILFILPILSYISTIIYIILCFTINLNPIGIAIFVLLNFILMKLCIRPNIFKIKATSYNNLLESYIDISKEFLNNKYESNYLINYQNKIKNDLSDLTKLKNIIDILSYRSNIIFQIIFNSLFLFDLIIIMILNKKSNNLSNIEEAHEIIFDLEVMISLSIIGIDNETYCIGEENNNINFSDLYHPLIKNPISNSLNINKGIILTGSNMSGKTTFLRTLGIAQTLFNLSGLIPSSSYSSSKYYILTSLRANDMLEEGISTFYAEILRMKKINEKIVNEKCLILIDEIFKGTNLNERLEASFKIIDKLNDNNQLFIISTHDFEICNAKNIINYHFNEYYENDKIYFDYKIKEGKSETTNALYLLKMANII